MDHDEWVKRMKAAADIMEADPTIAQEMFFVLADESRPRDGIPSEWRAQQARAMAGSAFLEMGRRSDAAALFEALAREHLAALNASGASAAQMFAEAALLQFQLGEGEAGEVLLREAMRLYGQFPEANLIFADAIREWRKHLDAKHSPDQAP